MSRVIREEFEKPRKVTKLVSVTCGSCGSISTDCSITIGVATVDWSDKTDSYGVQETTLKIREGHAYPEGGSVEERSYDVCATCMREKVEPFLKSIGLKPEVRETEF